MYKQTKGRVKVRGGLLPLPLGYLGRNLGVVQFPDELRVVYFKAGRSHGVEITLYFSFRSFDLDCSVVKVIADDRFDAGIVREFREHSESGMESRAADEAGERDNHYDVVHCIIPLLEWVEPYAYQCTKKLRCEFR